MNVGDLVDAGHAEIKTGPFGTQLRASDYVEHGRPVLNVRNVGFGDVRPKDFEYVDEATADRLSTHLLRLNDIVFGRKGAVERHAFIGPEYEGAMQGSDCIRLRVSEESPMPARFLTFALRTQQHQQWMKAFCSHGATMASLNQEIVRQIPLPDVDSAHQDLAVAVLQNIDDLIANNRRRVEVLEEMTRAIYREWFVKFHYPGHGDAPLVDSALGPIPEGWTAGTIGDALELKYGKALKADARRGGTVAVVSSAGVVGWHDESIVKGPAVVVGRKGNVGSVHWVEGPCWPIDTAYYVATDLPLRFVVEQLRRTEFTNTHAAVPGLSREGAYARPFIVPGAGLLDTFQSAVDPLGLEASALSGQSDSLAALRDSLLPKLVTGQIDVSSFDLDTLLEGQVA